MGYFAISRRNAHAPFEIEACHLNVWILPRPWFRHAYYFDVGLRIVSESELWRIRVAFPFDADIGDIVDLSAAVLQVETSELIFGRPVTVDSGHVKYSASGLTSDADEINDRVVAVSTTNSTPDPETRSDVNFSVWTVEFTTPLRANESSYVRFRMRVANPERLWSAKGWGYAKRGFIADIRVADARESVLLGIGKQEVDYLVPKRAEMSLGECLLRAPSKRLPSARMLRRNEFGMAVLQSFRSTTPNRPSRPTCAGKSLRRLCYPSRSFLAPPPRSAGSLNRSFDCSAYFLFASMAIHLRFFRAATYPVVLLPPNGSRTRSPLSVKNSTKKAASPGGIRAG
jgi:hypothetical protein